MAGDTTLPEAATLIAAVLVFDLWERLRPRRLFSRRRRLALDAFAIVVVMVFGTAWKALLGLGLDLAPPDALFAWAAPLQAQPSWIKVALGILLADFCLYWVHRAMHGAALWPAHAFHHSIEDLYWLSGARTSVTHLLLFAVPQVLIARPLLALTPGEAAVAFSFGVVVNLWVHANIRVGIGPLAWLIITPDVHRSHHARDVLPSKNLGFLLTIWDRLFGTWLDPRTLPPDYPLGLTGARRVDAKMIAGI